MHVVADPSDGRVPEVARACLAAGTDITRFNALRHGVLSRYTVLPWENADEYRAVVEGLVAEHGPHGPTAPLQENR